MRVEKYAGERERRREHKDHLNLLLNLCSSCWHSSSFWFAEEMIFQAACRVPRSEKRNRTHLATQPCTESSPRSVASQHPNFVVTYAYKYNNNSCAQGDVAASKQALGAAKVTVVLHMLKGSAIASSAHSHAFATQLCAEHTPDRATLLHPRIAIAHWHRSIANNLCARQYSCSLGRA